MEDFFREKNENVLGKVLTQFALNRKYMINLTYCLTRNRLLINKLQSKTFLILRYIFLLTRVNYR